MVLDVKYWIFLSFLLKLTGAEPQSQPTYRARDGEGVSPPPSGASSDKSCVRSYRAFKIKKKTLKIISPATTRPQLEPRDGDDSSDN